ncbi:hypothetical protein [Streptomyces sp. NPDC001652]
MRATPSIRPSPGHLTTHGAPMDEDHGTDFDGLAEAYERMATALPLRA